MDHHYSTLELVANDTTGRSPELVRYDNTARAPERDYDATAFEIDASALAPQVSRNIVLSGKKRNDDIDCA